MAGPLAGIRIIDLSERSPAAANAGMILADYGAEVIRVEPEGGDPLRVLDGARVWLRGQQSVIVRPEHLKDGSWERLRASADVILDTAHPWTAKPEGLLDGWSGDSGQILAILTAIPKSAGEAQGAGAGTGQPVYGELVEAQYGLMDAQDGYHRNGPIFLGWPHAAYGAAWLLELGILGALCERGQTGRGQVVTTSLLDGAAVLSTNRWLAGANVQASPRSLQSPRVAGARRSMMGLFECADGRWIQTHTGPRGAFGRLMKILGRDDLAGAENSAMAAMPAEAAEDLWRHAVKTYKTQPAQHWIDLLNQNDVCCMPALPPGDALYLEQMIANGLVDVTPEGRRQLGVPAKYSRTPIKAGRGVPAPGEHNGRLLEQPQPKFSPAPPLDGDRGVDRVGPLDSVLVVDLGFFMAGPFSPRTLADLGARVIKVEEVGGEPMRPRALPLGGWLGVQRGKEGMTLDLKTEEGRQVLYELVKKADVVHHNMRMGSLPRLGVDYDTIRKINPNVIYCHSSGYGNDGPWAPLPTLEPLHSALTGMLVRTAGQGNPPAYYLTHMDYGCGLTSTVAVLAALVERQRSGQGQYVEVPQTGAGLVAMSDVYYEGDQKSETFALDHDQRGHAPTNALYQTQDGWIVVSCYGEQDWRGVSLALSIREADWPSYERARHQAMDSETARAIERAVAAMTGAEAEQRLRSADVPCAMPTPFEPDQVVADPLLRKHGVILAETHPEAGEMAEVAHTIRFGTSTKHHTRPAPVLGQDTLRILRELGKSDPEIEALIAARVVHAAGRQPEKAASLA